MVKVVIAAVGRARPGPERSLFETYAKRMASPVQLHEVVVKGQLPEADQRDREAEQLLRHATGSGRESMALVALDGRGKTASSEQLADWFAGWRDDGTACAAFAIGGSHGHGDAVLTAASRVLSLGPMTWPHMLARVMLMEQIYRAQQILAGHPYHHA